MKKFEHWLRLDRAKDEQARATMLTLYTVLLLVSLATALTTLMHISAHTYDDALVVGIGFGICLGLLALTRLGQLTWVSWLLPCLFFVVITQQVWDNDKLYDEATFAYPALIALGGLLLGRRGVVTFLLLSAVTLSFIGYTHVHSLDPIYISRANNTRLTTILILIGVTGAIMYLVIDNLLRSLRNLHQKELALAQANQELQAIQTSLETQIEERTHSAEAARAEAEALNEKLKTQMWQIQGQARLSAAMRGQQDLPILAAHIIRTLCKYLGAPIGALYLRKDSTLTPIGSYATPQQYTSLPVFKLGEGTIGVAAQDKKRHVLTNLQPDHLTITSGLGQVAASTVVVLPVLYEDRVVGAIELGAFEAFTPDHLDFLEGSLESIAIALNTAQARARIENLLAETQQQALELQVREEELRAVNEEIRAQSEHAVKQHKNWETD